MVLTSLFSTVSVCFIRSNILLSANANCFHKYTENTSHSASVQPNQPHGFRISGQTLRSGHNKEVVIEDERVSAFLRYFLKADENDMIVIPLLPNSRWSDYLDHSVPLHSKRYRALYPKAGTILDLAPRTPPPFPQNQSPPLSLSQTLQELLPKSPLPRDDLGSPFSLSTSRLSLSTPTMPARSQNGSDKGITVSFPSSYYMVCGRRIWFFRRLHVNVNLIFIGGYSSCTSCTAKTRS